MSKKQNFSIHDRVEIFNYGNSPLNGKTGYIAGKGFNSPETLFWIVILDIPEEDQLAANIIETSLRKRNK